MPNISRRSFTFAGGAAATASITGAFGGSALALEQPVSHAAGSFKAQSLPPIAQFKIGRFQITAMADGYADMPSTYFPGRSREQIDALATSQIGAKRAGVRFLFNQYLIDDGERLILIDTGPAGSLGQTGRLMSAMNAIGVQPDHIDAVIVTHTHQDHIGGLVAGGQKNFAKAEIYVDRRDIKHWTDPAKRAAAPDYLKPSFAMTSELTRIYPRLQAIDGDTQIARGVSTVDLTGHTPGHIGVHIEDAGQSLTMASDMLFPVVHPAATDIFFLFEQDQPAAQAMRTKFYARAAAENTLVAATHMPFPGVGRIESDGGVRRWVAADWAYQD